MAYKKLGGGGSKSMGLDKQAWKEKWSNASLDNVLQDSCNL